MAIRSTSVSAPPSVMLPPAVRLMLPAELAMVGGALSALPAGLGGTEAVLVALLVGQGAAVGTAVALTVLVRLLTLWLAVALGLLALLYSVAIRKDIRF